MTIWPKNFEISSHWKNSFPENSFKTTQRRPFTWSLITKFMTKRRVLTIVVTSREFNKNKKIKKRVSQNFCGPHVPPPNPTTHHSHPLNFTHLSSLLAASLPSFFLSFSLFSFLFAETHTHTHRQPPLQNTLSHHHFSGKITGKILRNSKASSLFYLR